MGGHAVRTAEVVAASSAAQVRGDEGDVVTEVVGEGVELGVRRGDAVGGDDMALTRSPSTDGESATARWDLDDLVGDGHGSIIVAVRPDRILGVIAAATLAAGVVGLVIQPTPERAAPVDQRTDPGPPDVDAASGETSAPSTTMLVPTATGSSDGATAEVAPKQNLTAVKVTLGQQLVVTFSDASWEWSDPQTDDPAILQRTSVSANPTRTEVTARFDTKTEGSAYVTATKDPTCRRSRPPCAAPSELWELYVTVTN